MRKLIAVVILVALTCIGCGQASHPSSDPAVNLSTTSLTFASQTVGTTSAAQTVTLTNTGSTALSIGGITASPNYAQSNSCGSSLAVGAQCTISVTFKPTTTGMLTGSLSISDNASPSAQSVALTGTGGAAIATVNLSTTSLTFASQTVGTTSAAQTVTLTNTGSTALSISITATANFSQGNNCGSSLASGANCSILVFFAPTAPGGIQGTLSIGDSASSSVRTVALAGTAVAAQHAVLVSWTGSTSAGVVGYDVYRSTTSGSGYSMLNSSPLSGTSYVDSTVASGTTYYYVTTAVGSGGQQSTYSNQAAAVVP